MEFSILSRDPGRTEAPAVGSKPGVSVLAVFEEVAPINGAPGKPHQKDSTIPSKDPHGITRSVYDPANAIPGTRHGHQRASMGSKPTRRHKLILSSKTVLHSPPPPLILDAKQSHAPSTTPTTPSITYVANPRSVGLLPLPNPTKVPTNAQNPPLVAGSNANTSINSLINTSGSSIYDVFEMAPSESIYKLADEDKNTDGMNERIRHMVRHSYNKLSRSELSSKSSSGNHDRNQYHNPQRHRKSLNSLDASKLSKLHPLCELLSITSLKEKDTDTPCQPSSSASPRPSAAFSSTHTPQPPQLCDNTDNDFGENYSHPKLFTESNTTNNTPAFSSLSNPSSSPFFEPPVNDAFNSMLNVTSLSNSQANAVDMPVSKDNAPTKVPKRSDATRKTRPKQTDLSSSKNLITPNTQSGSVLAYISNSPTISIELDPLDASNLVNSTPSPTLLGPSASSGLLNSGNNSSVEAQKKNTRFRSYVLNLYNSPDPFVYILSGPILITAPHGLRLIRGGENGERRRIHKRERWVNELVLRIASRLNQQYGISPSFMLWNLNTARKADSSNLDPNYLTRPQFILSPWHQMLVQFRKRYPRMPVLHIDIHGKMDRKDNLDLDLGMEPMNQYWSNKQDISGIRGGLAGGFREAFYECKRPYIIPNYDPECVVNTPADDPRVFGVEEDPLLCGFWGPNSFHTMTHQAVALGIPSAQLEIPYTMRGMLCSNQNMLAKFADTIYRVYETVVVAAHDSTGIADMLDISKRTPMVSNCPQPMQYLPLVLEMTQDLENIDRTTNEKCI